jgi:hypothetical protein
MPLPMARPVKIKDSPNRQYVARIPSDVLDKARGQTVAVEIDGRQVSFRIGPTAQVVKFSLRTSDQALARSRHRAVAEYMSNWFDTLRTDVGRTALTPAEISRIADYFYAASLADDEAERTHGTGNEDPVRSVAQQLTDADIEYDIPLPLDAQTPAYGLSNREVTKRQAELAWYKPLMARALSRGDISVVSEHLNDASEMFNLSLDRNSPAYRELGMAVLKAVVQAQRVIERRNEGEVVDTPPVSSFEAGKLSAAVPFDCLIDGWVKEAKPVQSTVDQWRVYFRDLEETTGITDASKLTADHVIKWKDALLDRGGAVKTINDSKLAALSRVLTWAVENRKLTANVAKGIRVPKAQARHKDAGVQRRTGQHYFGRR